MSTIREILQDSVDRLFEIAGEEATYTPTGGSPVTVTVIPKRPDEILGFGESLVRTGTALFDVRASEVSSPAEQDALTFDGTAYVVQSVERRDPRRLIWTLDTREG